MGFASIHDLADIEPVLEQLREGAHAEADTAHELTVDAATLLGPDPATIEVLDQGTDRAKRKIALGSSIEVGPANAAVRAARPRGRPRDIASAP
jgi:hypothetical protein